MIPGSLLFTIIVVNPMKKSRPRRPAGRWVYYILYDGILWPCPVRWEWENGFDGWLPFYYSPTFEFVAGDPRKALVSERIYPTKTACETMANRIYKVRPNVVLLCGEVHR
ncbi:hypothetical protein CRX72_10265 [Pantoea sp. BRM17]|nr:hypothetical protein CRX72_10265 [Pantoea sp. BRM17]